ncbi:BIG/ATPase V1 complex, subunit S1 [Podospora australis]|uniref:Protein BIG1 n=1 Tax=Podospora australis TaxID=1536484 RepID=A0AAN6X4A2_9PEZI|nr:BIG/ATPase V1 complex, subunit S1 [Podospora australis]
MHLSIAATLLAYTAGVQAFTDSAPFILFSTAELPTSPNTAQLQTSAQVLASAKDILASCPTQRYFLVSQPNLHAADIRDGADNGRCHMPNLCRAIKSESTKGSYSVAEVIGQVSGQPLKEHIQAACKATGKKDVQIDRIELKHLPAVGQVSDHERREMLEDNDRELGNMLDVVGDDEDYTVVMFSDPNEFKPYQSEFAESPVAHMDLKRWAEEPVVGNKKGNSTYDNRSLFEKYQFFTPGVFMSLITLLILLSILTVGLKALASLEVSYGAFDKEMGPAAQKKQ